MINLKKKKSLFGGLFALSATFLSFSIMGSSLVSAFRTEIDNFTNTSSTQIVQKEGDGGEKYTFKPSDKCSTAKKTIEYYTEVGERMSEEGSVLLKNLNNALPLASANRKVTLLGGQSVTLVRGGQMGSSIHDNTSTEFPGYDLKAALEARGYEVNPSAWEGYQGCIEMKAGSSGGSSYSSSQQRAPGVGADAKFTNAEVPIATLDENTNNGTAWKYEFADYKTAIVVIGRNGGENRNYLPGTNGVSDADVALNQTDPLGLNDNERAILNLAVSEKAANHFDRVIVLLNNTSAMEIDEIKNNEGIDSIVQIGAPGAYGCLGIADLLKGEQSDSAHTPLSFSGHLTDTYATDISNAPASQNYGHYAWANSETIAADPLAANLGSTINTYLVEAEGIYSGYYYYESRYADVLQNKGDAATAAGISKGNTWAYDNEVSYTFGYGLSYTDFTQEVQNVDIDLANRKITTTVKVTNTGTVAGKEAVQLYVQAPYRAGETVDKSAVKLLDYGKTPVIPANGNYTLTLESDLQDIASWDSEATNAINTKGTYVLDAGNYYFTAANGAHEAINNILINQGVNENSIVGEKGSAPVVKNFATKDTTTLNRSKNGTALENQMADGDLNYYVENEADKVTYLSRSNWKDTWPKTYNSVSATADMIKMLVNDVTTVDQTKGSDVVFGEKNGLKLADLKGVTDINDARWSELMDQITLEECMKRIAFGGSSCKAITSIQSPEVVQNDGPNGFNSNSLTAKLAAQSKEGEGVDPYFVSDTDANKDFNAGCMALPGVIAQTFSKEMAYEWGEATGNYSIWSHETILWGCGGNLHRTPYNARNHEYFSEDPILSGYQGAMYIQGAQKYGAIIGPKHFAFNDTEINRQGIAPFTTEQTAREKELRGFQLNFEVGEALGGMTTFSRIGVTPMNSHKGLTYNVLRKEWGFKGMLSTDMANNKAYFSPKECANVGVTMTTNTCDETKTLDEVISDSKNVLWSYWTVSQVEGDGDMEASVKECMLWQNYAIANSNAMNGMNSNTEIITIRTWYDNLLTAMQATFAVLTVAAVSFYGLSVYQSKKD
ncbi:MAG: glycoside hydrolase family 3 C-terminal domain-containing protein [Bacilli bacterium]